MNLISDVRLKWYDESCLGVEENRELVRILLDSLGVTRDVALDIFEVLLMAKSDGISMTGREIKDKVIGLRKERKVKKPRNGLTDRNIQLWLRFFREIDLIERVGSRHLFSGNKKPSKVWLEKTKPNIIDKSAENIHKILLELENRYEI
ncbi:unnamed protein product [marine sediment metagenome]|uniref:Uncharacterized protein n=1 Tax=marine sediment metagenome TaxID=412755 RepID=X0UYN0_9ZZZZ